MGDVVNLRQVRKQKARSDKARAAQANRVKFGMTKIERQAIETQEQRRVAHLEGHRRDEPVAEEG